MKKFKTLLVAVAMIAGLSMPAAAQFRIGPRLGVTVNELHMDKAAMLDGENRTGFTGGLMAEFTVPVIGIGLDASVMYVRREGRLSYVDDGVKEVEKLNRNYIGVPINLKYKISIPAVSNIITPFITTGPEFDFLCSKKVINDMKSKTCDVAWNVGLGVQLINHIQVAASYGFGISSAVKYVDSDINTVDVRGKDRFWTITAAYLF